MPAIKQDDIAEEVYAARRYSKRITRTVIVTNGDCERHLALAVVGLAMRPQSVFTSSRYAWGSATPVKYSDLEHYTPDAAVGEDVPRRLGHVPLWPATRHGAKDIPEELFIFRVEIRRQVRDRDRKTTSSPNLGWS